MFYVKPCLPELEKGTSGAVLGDNFSHVSLQDDSCYSNMNMKFAQNTAEKHSHCAEAFSQPLSIIYTYKINKRYVHI